MSVRNRNKILKQRKYKGIRDLVVLIMVIVIVSFAVVCVKQQYDLSKIRTERNALMQQIEAAKIEQKRVEDEKKKMSDPQYIEQVAREQGMTKPGEIPYIINEKQSKR